MIMILNSKQYIPEGQLYQERGICSPVHIEDSLEGVEYSQTRSDQICSEHQSSDTTRSITTHNTQYSGVVV